MQFIKNLSKCQVSLLYWLQPLWILMCNLKKLHPNTKVPNKRDTLVDLGEPTHILVSCWMPKPLPPRNQCTGCFTPTYTCIQSFSRLVLLHLLYLDMSDGLPPIRAQPKRGKRSLQPWMPFVAM